MSTSQNSSDSGDMQNNNSSHSSHSNHSRQQLDQQQQHFQYQHPPVPGQPQQQQQPPPPQGHQQPPTSQEMADSNKRAALAGQWRTPPLPVFPTSTPSQQAPPAPASSSSLSGMPGPTKLPDNSDDYAKALQEAYRRGAEAAAAMAVHQQNMSPSASCPNFQMAPITAPAPPPPPPQQHQQIMTSRSEDMTTSTTSNAPPPYSHPPPPQPHAGYHPQYAEHHQYGAPPPHPHHPHHPQQQPPPPHHHHPQQPPPPHHPHHAHHPHGPPHYAPPPPQYVAPPLTQQHPQQPPPAPGQQQPPPPPQQHQQQQPPPPPPQPQDNTANANKSGNTTGSGGGGGIPNPLTNMPPPPKQTPTHQRAPQQAAAAAAPTSSQIVVNPPQQRSVSLPDMTSYAVQAEEEKRQKRLARNRASARLRRLRKKNLVDAYETEVGILEKTLQQLKAHEWGCPTTGPAAAAAATSEKSHQSLLEALCMDRGQQVISSEQRAQQCQDILEQQLQQMELLRQVQWEQQLLAATSNENKDDDPEIAEMASELSEVLELSDDQKSQLQGASKGLDEEMIALDTVFSSLVMMKDNDWLLNQGVQDITDQLTSILHKNQMSKFLLWSDANVEAIDQLDHVHAAPKNSPHPQGPIFTFGVETTPMDDEGDGK